MRWREGEKRKKKRRREKKTNKRRENRKHLFCKITGDESDDE
jgi:hypothetical protein